MWKNTGAEQRYRALPVLNKLWHVLSHRWSLCILVTLSTFSDIYEFVH